MTNSIRSVKRKLDEAITQLCEVSWMFSKHPDRDFTRTRKLPFRKVIWYPEVFFSGLLGSSSSA